MTGLIDADLYRICTRERTPACRAVGTVHDIRYHRLVAVLNSIPDPACILTTSTIALAAVCMIAPAARKLARWIERGKVMKMVRKVAGPWWAPASVVGIYHLTWAAGSG